MAKHDRRIIKLALLAGNFLFFYAHLTGLWSFQFFMLAKVYVDCTETTRRCVSWLMTFFCVESIVFWYFTVTTAKHDRVKGRFSGKLEAVLVTDDVQSSNGVPSPRSNGVTNRSGWKSEQDGYQVQSETLRCNVTKLTERYRFKSDVSKLLEYAGKYLVWHDCAECGRVPPRSFHCTVCGTCVLKRDHHCFVTGVCVGHSNQRHFLVFNLYTAAATVLHMYTTLSYFRLLWLDAAESTQSKSQSETKAKFDFDSINFTYVSLFLPVTVFQTFVQRSIPVHLFCAVSHCYLLIYVAVMTMTFTVVEIGLVLSGYTMNELKYVSNLRVNEPLSNRVRSVFGSFCFFNLLVPMHWCCKQPVDGTQSPAVTVKLNRWRDVQAEVLTDFVAASDDTERLNQVLGLQLSGKVHDV